MKVRDVLQNLPSPYREQALANTNDNMLNHIVEDTDPALVLYGCFSFKDSPEGATYWSNFCKKVDIDTYV